MPYITILIYKYQFSKYVNKIYAVVVVIVTVFKVHRGGRLLGTVGITIYADS